MHAQVIAQPSPSSSQAFYNRVIGDHKDVIGGMEIDFLWFTGECRSGRLGSRLLPRL